MDTTVTIESNHRGFFVVSTNEDGQTKYLKDTGRWCSIAYESSFWPTRHAAWAFLHSLPETRQHKLNILAQTVAGIEYADLDPAGARACRTMIDGMSALAVDFPETVDIITRNGSYAMLSDHQKQNLRETLDILRENKAEALSKCYAEIKRMEEFEEYLCEQLGESFDEKSTLASGDILAFAEKIAFSEAVKEGLGDGAVWVLRRFGRPAKMREISERMVNLGLDQKYGDHKTLANSLFNTLKRREDCVKNDDATWGLVEWAAKKEPA